MPTSENGSSTSEGPWLPPSVEELQALLPQYQIESILGRGGMGAVYRGVQVTLQRPVAIKLLPETLISNDNDHQYAERFKLEARAMANLDHPAIISVFDFGQTSAGHLYFVMEFIDGMDIEQYISASGGKVDPEHAVAIVSHVLDALNYAHSEGIVHRDIKPANVLINREGRVKIADFGLAKQFGSEASELTGLTMTNMAMGTPDYIAPEALELHTETDHRADLYAVGVMLYKMLTGKLPRGMFKMPSEEINGLDERFDDIIALAMDNDPGGRYQSATEFRNKLDELQSAPISRVEASQQTGAVSPAVSARLLRKGIRSEAPSPVPSRSPDERKKKPIKIGIASLLGVGGILAIFFLTPIFRQESSTPPLTEDSPVLPSENTAITSPSPGTEIVGNADDKPNLFVPISQEHEDRLKSLSKESGGEPNVSDHNSSNSAPTESSEAPSIANTLDSAATDPAAAPSVSNPVSKPSLPPTNELNLDLMTLADWKTHGNSDWEQRNGVIGGKGARGHLYREIPAKEFEITGELFCSPEANGGVGFWQIGLNAQGIPAKGGYEFQISGSQNSHSTKTGSLTTRNPVVSVASPLAPDNQWVPFRVRVSETLLEGWLDGKSTFSVPPLPETEHPRGKRIHLQQWGDGGQVAYRNLKLTSLELSRTGGITSTRPDQEPEWEPLKNSANLNFWQGSNLRSWSSTNGELWHRRGKDGTISIPTGLSNEGFELKGEFRTSPDGNGGIFVEDVAELALTGSLGIKSAGVWTGGVFSDDGKANTPLRTPPQNPILDNTWTEFQLSWDGKTFTTWVAGKETARADIPRSPSNPKIALQGRPQGIVAYRNLKIRKLPNSPRSYHGPDETWNSLFNGNDLSGWSVKGGSSAFTVEDSQIKGMPILGSPSTYLTTVDRYGDFELEFEVKLTSKVNSGVQIRSRLINPRTNPYGGELFGPQIEVEQSPGLSSFIYGQALSGWISKNPVQHNHFINDEFNHFRILAEGQRVRTWLNGVPIEDNRDAKIHSGFHTGFIALQIHRIDDSSEAKPVYWRNIFLRQID